jgi:hypothetical protein
MINAVFIMVNEAFTMIIVTLINIVELVMLMIEAYFRTFWCFYPLLSTGLEEEPAFRLTMGCLIGLERPCCFY